MLETLIYSTLLYAAVVAATFYRRRVGLANPLVLYLAFHGLAFIGRGWGQYLWTDDYLLDLLGIPSHQRDLSTALLIADVGLLAFWFGYQVLVPRRLVDGIRFRERRRDPRIVLFVGACFLLLGLVSLSKDPMFNSGATQMVRTYRGAIQAEGTVGYLSQASVAIGGVFALWAAVFGFKPWIVVGFVLYTIVRVMRGWGRWTFVLGVLSLVFVDMWRRGARWPRKQWVVAALLVGVAFGTVGVARTVFIDAMRSGGQVDLSRSLRAVPLQISRDTGILDYIVYAMWVTAEAGYTYGTEHIKLFTYPIPRTLWPGKPIQTGRIDLSEYGLFTLVGGVLSAPGAAYLDFGWGGVVGQMMLLGAVLATLHRIYLNNRTITHVAVPYLLGLALLVQFYRDGQINIFVFLYFHVLPSVIALWAAARFRQLPQRLWDWLSLKRAPAAPRARASSGGPFASQ